MNKKNRINPAFMLFVAAPMAAFPANAETSVESADDAAETRVTLVRDSSSDRQPLKTVFPSYPSIARRDRIEGEVTVCFDIDARGKVKHASIRSYTHKIFRKPSLRAIRSSSYEPLPPDQVLARTETCRTYRYRLKEMGSDPLLSHKAEFAGRGQKRRHYVPVFFANLGHRPLGGLLQFCLVM